MNDDIVVSDYIVLIHNLIRNLILSSSFSEIYPTLSKQLFPLYDGFFKRSNNSISLNQLFSISRRLYEYDEKNIIDGTCLSISLTIQAVLFSKGQDSFLVFGLTKKDEKLQAHCWIELLDGIIIDTQYQYNNLKTIGKLSMYEEIERMFLKHEDMDSKNRNEKSVLDKLVK